MFGRRLNGFEDYTQTEEMPIEDKTELDVALTNARVWGNEVWGVITEKAEERGGDITREGNKRGRSKTKREILEVGDLVVKKCMSQRLKFAKCFEGPFEVKEFVGGQKGYQLEDMEGKLLKGCYLIEHLKLVDKAFADNEVKYEIEEVVSHRALTEGSYRKSIKRTSSDSKSFIEKEH